MRKKVIMTVALVMVAIVSYLVGTTQSSIITEAREVVPDGYINTETEDFKNNFVDMRQVTGFSANDGRLYLYMIDGSGYYWER